MLTFKQFIRKGPPEKYDGPDRRSGPRRTKSAIPGNVVKWGGRRKDDGIGEAMKDPCWDNYKMIGMKKKGNRMVPNCVPKNEDVDLEEASATLSDEEILRDFIDFCSKELELESMPQVKLCRDPQWSVVNRTFGRYIDDRNLLEVAWGQRHIMDVLRTVAHELTHRHQHERESVPGDAGETGSSYENEANARAGILMRDYAGLHPEYFAVDKTEEATPYYNKPSFLTKMSRIAKQERKAREKKKAKAEKSVKEELTADEQFDLIEEVIEELALKHNLDPEYVWEKFEQFSDKELLEYAVDAKGHKSSTGGLTQKGRDAYNTKGANLQAPVTTPPSELKAGSKAANRRKSFCARMGGVEGPMRKPNGEPTRKALALRKWNC